MIVLLIVALSGLSGGWLLGQYGGEWGRQSRLLRDAGLGMTLLAWSWHKGPGPGIEPHALNALHIGMVTLPVLMAALELS